MNRAPLVAAFVLAGCDTSISTPNDLSSFDFAPPPPFCIDGADGGPAATLAAVEHVLSARCTASGCHGANFPAVVGLDLRAGHVVASTVGKPATEACGGTLVTAGDPTRSFLYQKIADATPCDGLQMPRCEDGTCPIPMCEIDVVRRWIAAGAPAR